MEMNAMLGQFEQVKYAVTLRKRHKGLNVTMLTNNHLLWDWCRNPQVVNAFLAAKERQSVEWMGPEIRISNHSLHLHGARSSAFLVGDLTHQSFRCMEEIL